MRPHSIVMFERLYLGAWVIGIVNTILAWDRSVATLEANAEASAMFGSGFLYVTTAVGFIIPLLLWFFIARKGSAVAKWILVVLFAIGVIGIAFAAFVGTMAGGLSGILAILAFALQAGAVHMLFRPDTGAWFGESVTE